MAKARKPAKAAAFDESVLDELLGGRTTGEDLDELFRQMKKSLMERVLRGELTHHLGYEAGEAKPAGQTNQRNGHSAKTVLTEDGAIPVDIPRDRDGTFEPMLIPKHECRLPRFDQNVISLDARGMTVREIQGHLEELYQVAISPDVISTVTESVLEPLFQYPLPVRRLLSTTNAVESVHRQLRKIIKTRGHFPTDDAALKLLYLTLRNLSKKWRLVAGEWRVALPHFAILFADRFTPVTD